MAIVELAPWLAGATAAVFVVAMAVRRLDSAPRISWMLPAALSILFLAWTISAMVAEGPVGFWREHTHSLWANQIWFDLLLAVCIGWYLIVQQARDLGMRVLPWSLLILCTGCIGFLAMISRYLFLKERHELRQTN